MLHRAKKTNPDAVVVAAGCYVQAAHEELKKDLSVDIIIGNNKKQDLVPILEAYFAEKAEAAVGQETGKKDETVEEKPLQETDPTVGSSEQDNVIDIGHTNEYESLSISRIADHTRAFIKIQDGCNQFCSYCIIPYTRGRVRSRRPDEVIEEVKTLVKNGYQEIVLTGIHLSSYGVDFPEEERIGLLDLILRLHPIEGLKRIRLGSLEPRIITEEFAKTLAGLDKFCPHFHLSLQSGCDETLKRMNRHYTTEEYAAGCEILRKHFHNPAITTDVIVGFAGETEEEFAQTEAFLEQIHFYEMHVFKYSRRAGTRADRMPNQIPEPVKTERSDVLLKLEQKMSEEYRRSFLNQNLEVLLEEKVTIDGVDYMLGHTKEYVKVAVPYQPDMKNVFVTGTAEKMLNDETLFVNL
jgi:threonylcarbamoyladenosine tRNA methylthiotransferase MtaB